MKLQIDNRKKFDNEIQIENEVNTTIDFLQWKLIRERGLISKENLY